MLSVQPAVVSSATLPTAQPSQVAVRAMNWTISVPFKPEMTIADLKMKIAEITKINEAQALREKEIADCARYRIDFREDGVPPAIGTPAKYQRLVIAQGREGVELGDCQTMASYGIKNGDFIDLVLKRLTQN